MKYDEIGQEIANAELIDFYQAIGWQAQLTWTLSAPSEVKPTRYVKPKSATEVTVQTAVSNFKQVTWWLAQSSQALVHQLPATTTLKHEPSAADQLQLTLILPEELLSVLYQSKFHAANMPYATFRNQVYLKVARGLVKWRYLLTQLTATAATPDSKVRSAVNHLSELALEQANQLDYHNLETYHRTQALATKLDNVVVNTDKNTITSLTVLGIELNPFVAGGLNKATVAWLTLLVTYLVMAPAPATSDLPQWRTQAVAVAGQNPFGKLPEASQAQGLFAELNQLAEQLGDHALLNSNQTFQKYVSDPMNTPAATFHRKQAAAGGADQLRTQLSQAGTAQLRAGQATALTPAITYNQAALVQAALAADQPVSLLSQTPAGNLFAVGAEQHLFGLNAGAASSELTAALVRDKVAAKRVVKKAGGHTLLSYVATDLTQAKQILRTHFANSALVVKSATAPSTHPVVFRTAPTTTEYLTAVKATLATHQPALIEAIQPGAVYRVLVLGGKIVSIVERISARVVGDGRSTIDQLVKRANLKRSQTSQLQLGQSQLAVLKQQGLTAHSVPQRGIEAYLSFAASLHLGQQHYEQLSEVDASYHQPLQQMLAALNLTDGAIDVIMPNIYQKYDAAHPELLTFLSATTTPDWRMYDDVLMHEHRNFAAKYFEEHFA